MPTPIDATARRVVAVYLVDDDQSIDAHVVAILARKHLALAHVSPMVFEPMPESVLDQMIASMQAQSRPARD
jgi:hypothetical protein